MPEIVLSVGEFVELVNQTLEFAYSNVVVEGEISGFQIRQEKWVHFDLKDKEATVNCFMTTYGMKTPLQDGMKIRVTGLPKVTTWGRFSLNVRGYELAGEGALNQAYELLKAKLESEGLFEQARKRELPLYPSHIGLVTSAQSEAFKDFVKIINERWGGVRIDVANVQVQGVPAPDQIVAAIKYFNTLSTPPDTLVIVRGGGSLEDLQAFNSEPVARAIAGSRTPTVVGVGHEGDITLADMVADLRAATPTDAARKVVPNKQEVISSIKYQESRMHSLTGVLLSNYRETIQHLGNRLEAVLRLPQAQVDTLSHRLLQSLVFTQRQVDNYMHRVGERRESLLSQSRYYINDQIQRLNSLTRTLQNLDPAKVLAKGYAIARANGRIVKTAAGLKKGDELMLQLAKDTITTEVKNV